jgi:hypothetical protein
MQHDETPAPQPIDASDEVIQPGAKQTWFKRHRKLLIIGGSILVVLLVATGVTLAMTGFFNPPKKTVVVNKPKPTQQPEKPKPKYYSPLTGAEVPTEADQTKPVTGMMIENSPDARPQSGLKNSGVVFEAIAEGGITRFMVLYQQEKPQMIGPVRSIRAYDLDWLRPFDASIGHVGGSSNALSIVRDGSWRDIDQFFNGNYYWRSTDRYAPHNVYTSFAKIDALNQAKGYLTSNPKAFLRKDSTAAKTPTKTVIDLTISSALYNVEYKYNATTNTYDRYQAGQPHLDREEGQISPRVVIAIMVNETTVFEDGWREAITTIGSGQAWIYQDGEEIAATWHKDSQDGQVYFTDASGNQVALARGQTWITAVPESGGVTSQ